MRLLEAALIATVLAPVALSRPVRATLLGLDAPRRAAVPAMLGLALAGQLALGTGSFPFVNWHMYAAVRHGDALVYEYDAVLRSGRRIPLVPGRFIGPESADRLMEALRRQVDRLKAGAGAAARREHEQALVAVAGLYDDEHPDDRIATVLVSERTIAIRSGASGRARTLWAVGVP